jgi:flagellar biosynthesis/type III secretory pathway M-ring protein FliF/YscJ
MAKAIAPVVGLILVLLVIWVLAALTLHTVRRSTYKRAEDEIKLAKMRKMVDLDLKLAEWQATASLEDLSKQRERLNRDLDTMHREIQAMPDKPGQLAPPKR